MKTVSLAEVTDQVKTWNPTKSPDSEFTYVDLSAVDNERKSVTKSLVLRGRDAPSRARQLIKAADVLVSTVRPNLNAVAAVTADLDGATASTGFTVLRPTELLDSRYLFHWVRTPSFVCDMVSKATGASYPAVSDRIVKESLIPLPLIEEQRRIAAILDNADTLVARRRAVVALLDTISQSIFADMFGDPAADTGNHHTAKHPVVRLVEWIDPDRPITYGILKPGPDIEGGVPYVRVADMKEGGIHTAGVRRTTRAIADQYKRSTLRQGDLLMSIRGHVGRFAFIPRELDGANITQDSARLAICEPDSAIYVRAAMEMPGLQQWMARRTKGAAVRGINLGDLKELPIPCPPMRLQKRFAAALRQINEQRSIAQSQLGLMTEGFRSLQSRAFSEQL